MNLHSTIRLIQIVASTGLALYTAAVASLNSSSYRDYRYAQSNTKFCGVGNAAAAGSSCSGDAAFIYSALTYHDFVLWAAAWNYKATSNTSVLIEAEALQQAYLQTEGVAGLQ